MRGVAVFSLLLTGTIFPMRFCFLVLILFFICLANAPGQGKKNAKNVQEPVVDSLPYQKYPTLPAFNILLLDSTTIFNTFNIEEGKPSLIVFFDPECKHCKLVTKMLLCGMDSLKDVNVYMISSVHSIGAIKRFYDEYRLGDYKNILVVGRDYEFFFVTYYGVKFVPDIVVYDSHKNLVKFFEGHTTISELYSYTH